MGDQTNAHVRLQAAQPSNALSHAELAAEAKALKGWLASVITLTGKATLIVDAAGKVIRSDIHARQIFGIGINDDFPADLRPIPTQLLRKVSRTAVLDNFPFSLQANGRNIPCKLCIRVVSIPWAPLEAFAYIVCIDVDEGECALSRPMDQSYYRIDCFKSMRGSSPEFRAVWEKAQSASFLDPESSVLISGEEGTGKEGFARAIHQRISPNGPFVICDCASMHLLNPERLLFGWRQHHYLPGLFEQANGGTLLLDNIECLSPSLQPLFLSVLDEHCINRFGESKPHPARFKLIAATTRAPGDLVQLGIIRPDLYYRISENRLALPALRMRREDIGSLVNLFIEIYCKTRNVPPISCPPEVRAALTSYDWPGNLRELRASVKYACCICRNSTLSLDDFSKRIIGLSDDAANPHPLKSASLKQLQLRKTEEALKATNGNVTEAAKMLGIGRSTLYKRLKREGISV